MDLDWASIHGKRWHDVGLRFGKFWDILSLEVFLILQIILIYLFPDSSFRIILGLPLLLLFPGYILLAFLFPDEESFDSLERLLFSFAGSLVTVPMIGLSLNYIPNGISLGNTLLGLVSFCLMGGVAAAYRRANSFNPWVPDLLGKKEIIPFHHLRRGENRQKFLILFFLIPVLIILLFIYFQLYPNLVSPFLSNLFMISLTGTIIGFFLYFFYIGKGSQRETSKFAVLEAMLFIIILTIPLKIRTGYPLITWDSFASAGITHKLFATNHLPIHWVSTQGWAFPFLQIFTAIGGKITGNIGFLFTTMGPLLNSLMFLTVFCGLRNLKSLNDRWAIFGGLLVSLSPLMAVKFRAFQPQAYGYLFFSIFLIGVLNYRSKNWRKILIFLVPGIIFSHPTIPSFVFIGSIFAFLLFFLGKKFEIFWNNIDISYYPLIILLIGSSYMIVHTQILDYAPLIGGYELPPLGASLTGERGKYLVTDLTQLRKYFLFIFSLPVFFSILKKKSGGKITWS